LVTAIERIASDETAGMAVYVLHVSDGPYRALTGGGENQGGVKCGFNGTAVVLLSAAPIGTTG